MVANVVVPSKTSDVGQSGKPKPSLKASLQKIVSFCRPEYGRIALGMTALAVNSATNLTFPWIMGQAVDRIADKSSSHFNFFIFGTTSLFCIGGIASWVRVYCIETATSSIASRLRMGLFNRFMDESMEELDESRTGEYISLLEKDVAVASETLTEKLAGAFRSLNSAVNGSILLLMTSPKLCAVSLSVIPLVGVAAMTMVKYSKGVQQALRDLESRILSFSLERLNGISTVKLNDRENYEKENYTKLITNGEDLARKNSYSHGAFMGFINLATNMSLAAVLFVGGGLISQGEMTTGSLTRFAIQSAFVGLGFSGLSTVYSDFVKSLDAVGRIFATIEGKKKSTEIVDSNSSSSSSTSPLPLLKACSIRLENINFAYPKRPDYPVLSNLTLEIPAKTMISIVGPSGSGKSTLLSLLCGLYRPTTGQILVNDIPLNSSYSSATTTIDATTAADTTTTATATTTTTTITEDDNKESSRDELWARQYFGVVEQQPILLSGTIAENIAYGKMGATMEEIIQAAQAACAHEFISSFPKGYDTEVGERGHLLSGGQCARIALARALVRDPPVLILDEVSAALDQDTEYALMDVLRGLRGSKTVIMFTHSPSCMKMADQIHALHQGKLMAFNSYEDFLSSHLMKHIIDAKY